MRDLPEEDPPDWAKREATMLRVFACRSIENQPGAPPGQWRDWLYDEKRAAQVIALRMKPNAHKP